MSAVRQAIALAWAAIWLRWRLASTKARGLFGSRPPTSAGSGYYLSAGEIPVEGVDYDLVEPPPELTARLEATRAELVEHARGATARRVRRRRVRRRRTASLAMAALLTLAVLGAGAAALVTGSTGVPAVDRLLGIYEQNLDRPGAPERPGPSGSGVQPDPSIPSSSVELPTGGGDRIVSASYVSRDGRVCVAVTSTDRSPAGRLGCVSAVRLADLVAKRAGVVLNVQSASPGVVVAGFVRGDVSSLEGSGPRGPLDVRVGDIWTPGLADFESVKPFIALAAPVSGRGLDPRDYRMTATTDRGERLPIAP